MKKKLVTTLSVILTIVIALGAFAIVGSASPYQKAVKQGYNGTEMQMLCSLAAETDDASVTGNIGSTSYEEAKNSGFKGSAEDWYSLFVKGDADTSKTVYENAGKDISLNQWLTDISSNNLKKEAKAASGNQKSAYVYACEYGFDGSPEEWIASLIGKNEGKKAISASSLFITASAAKASPDCEAVSAYVTTAVRGLKLTLQKFFRCLLGLDNMASGYDVAVANGYTGTEVEWLRSLAGENGKSAYEIACDNGYEGTEIEWLASLAGENGSNGESAYEIAVRNGFNGTEKEWLESLIGPTGAAGVNGNDGKSAYEIAVEKGYTGTEDEWLASLVGGGSAVGANGKSAYELAVENGFEGSLTEWLASLKGDKGDTGATGAQGPKGDKGDTGATGAQGPKGDKGDTGATGEQGPKGDKGDTGATGAQGPKGDKGDTGAAGADGKSAYDLAVENGYTGTVQEWLYSLKGENSTYGANGKSAYELAKQEGFTGSLSEWLDSLRGPKGDKGDKGEAGAKGADGKSAYDIAVENGFNGSVTEWLASLVGKDGAAGANGAAGQSAYELAVANGYSGTQQQWLASLIGAKGEDGKSAYAIACDNGYQGTEQQWLASLVGPQGPKGDKGETGAQGSKGDKGETGATGAQGPKGDKGDTGAAGATGAQGPKGDTGAAGAKGDKGDTGAAGTAGNGVQNAYVNDSYHLILEMTDGSTIDAGYVGVNNGGNEGDDPEPSEPSFTNPTLYVSNAKASAGDTVDVKVSIANNPGIAGAILKLSYDSGLTLTNATVGDAFGTLTYTKPGRFANPCNFSWDSESGMATDDGLVLTLTFKVSDSASAGDKLGVNFSYGSGAVYDDNLDDVSLDVVNGYVTVK